MAGASVVGAVRPPTRSPAAAPCLASSSAALGGGAAPQRRKWCGGEYAAEILESAGRGWAVSAWLRRGIAGGGLRPPDPPPGGAAPPGPPARLNARNVHGAAGKGTAPRLRGRGCAALTRPLRPRCKLAGRSLHSGGARSVSGPEYRPGKKSPSLRDPPAAPSTGRNAETVERPPGTAPSSRGRGFPPARPSVGAGCARYARQGEPETPPTTCCRPVGCPWRCRTVLDDDLPKIAAKRAVSVLLRCLCRVDYISAPK